MGSDVAEIREAGPGEAMTAFRIHYHPALDCEPRNGYGLCVTCIALTTNQEAEAACSCTHQCFVGCLARCPACFRTTLPR